MTDEKFDTRINDKGQTEFAYGISWRNTSQESLLRDGRLELKRRKNNDPFFEKPSSRFSIQANNQTKLDLEDRAAEGLQKRLNKEQLCKKGHDIKQVIWKADNIRLTGHCL
jgi:hypothetical protein